MSTLVLSDSKEHRWAKTAFISGAGQLVSFLSFERPIPKSVTSLDIKFMLLKFARHLARTHFPLAFSHCGRIQANGLFCACLARSLRVNSAWHGSRYSAQE